jgi:DNA-binding IclR family transcriptional regulator
MAKTEIPDEVRRFVLTSIPSIPHIEALMLVRATTPARWAPDDLARRLYVPPAVARSVLADLCSSKMIREEAQSTTYYFDAPSAELNDVIAKLAILYSSNLVEITLLIHSKLERKAQQFADAFDFRKEN